jgi:hypothetical protein
MLNTCRDAGASVFITIVDSLSSHRKFSDKHLGPSCSCSCSSCSRFSSEPNLVGMAVMMMMVQVARCQIHQLALPETQIIAATPRLFASSPALKGNALRRFFAADGLQVR